MIANVMRKESYIMSDQEKKIGTHAIHLGLIEMLIRSNMENYQVLMAIQTDG